ncbi:MAG TPA: tyrosine--tRNA ligase [Nitrososphaeraceae archaeon]|nr:tyrosine--tRNA ligase [Nitrososphaeraceae archaeon]
MDVESRIGLVLREPTEEVVEVTQLRQLFETNSKPRHYIGLEISGKLHLGSLILTGYKINDFIKAGVNTNVFLADWHTYINNKLDNDWQKIIEVSKYFGEAFKFFCPGVNIILGSSLYDTYDDYWKNFMIFSKHMTLSRTLRALTIMGRSEKEKLDFSQLMYPSMQSADIKALDLDIVHAGMDQRKIHMLVREIFPKLGWKVPVSVHHHLLPGLNEPTKLASNVGDEDDYRISSKMSKTTPLGGILIHDDENTIKSKITRAYCPIGISENNPILEIIKYVIFHNFSQFQIERQSKYGGNIVYDDFTKLESDYNQKKIHPKDLKDSVSIYLNKIIEPIRNHFEDWTILDDL